MRAETKIHDPERTKPRKPSTRRTDIPSFEPPSQVESPRSLSSPRSMHDQRRIFVVSQRIPSDELLAGAGRSVLSNYGAVIKLYQ
jgi:hypothetical protein